MIRPKWMCKCGFRRAEHFEQENTEMFHQAYQLDWEHKKVYILSGRGIKQVQI